MESLSPRMSTSIKRKFGFLPTQILQDVINALLKDDTLRVSPEMFRRIWSIVRTQDGATLLAKELLRWLLEDLSGDEAERLRASALSTLLMLDLFFPLDGDDEELRVLLSDWHEFVNAASQSSNSNDVGFLITPWRGFNAFTLPSSILLLCLVSFALLSEQRLVAALLFHHNISMELPLLPILGYVSLPSVFHVEAAPFTHASDKLTLTVKGEFASAYPFLSALATEGSVLRLMLEAITNLLLKMPSYLRAHPSEIPTHVTTLMFVLRHIISAHPVPDPSLIAALAPILANLLTTWPKPYCDEARETLAAVVCECLAPGWSYRR